MKRLAQRGEQARNEGASSTSWQRLLMLDEATQKQVNKRHCSPPMSRATYKRLFAKAPPCRLAPRHGVAQGEGASFKIRPIDDHKKSGVNAALMAKETIVLPTVEQPSKVAAEFFRGAEERGLPCPALGTAFEDFESAYCIVPTRDPTTSVIAYFSPKAGAVVFHEIYGHCFGLVAAVTNFSRVPHMYTHFMCAFYAVPMDHYIDDNIIVDAVACDLSGQNCLGTLCLLTGSTLAKRQTQAPRAIQHRDRGRLRHGRCAQRLHQSGAHTREAPEDPARPRVMGSRGRVAHQGGGGPPLAHHLVRPWHSPRQAAWSAAGSLPRIPMRRRGCHVEPKIEGDERFPYRPLH